MADVFDLQGKITLLSNVKDQLAKDAGLMQTFMGKAGGILGMAAKAGTAAVSAMSAASVGFVKTAVDAGKKFDSSMSGVGAISGATEEDLEKLRTKALEMGESTKFSASEAADAMQYMAMAGWKTEDMLGGIAGVMNLAAASGEDLATTSDIVTDALTAFGLTASDSGDFANVLAAASSNANTNVSMMGETFKYVAPLAGSLNIDYKDMAEAIGLVANAGIKGSQAGTSLRSILTRLSTDAGASEKKLGALGIMTKELGVAFYDDEGKVRDFSDILDEARVAWDKLDPKKATEFAKQIAGQEGMSAWLAMMNAAPEDIEKLRGAIVGASEEIDGFDGAAAKMADTMEQNLQGAMTSFGSAMEGLQISISDKVSPILAGFVSLGTEAVRGMSAAFREKGLEGLVGAIQEPLSKFIGKITELLPTVIGVGIDLVGALGKGILDNSGQIISGGVDIIKKLAEGIAKAIPDLYQGAKTIVSQLASEVIANAPAILESGMTIATTLLSGIFEDLKKLPNELQKINLAGTIGDFFSGAVESLKGSMPDIVNTGKELITSLFASAEEALPMISEVIMGIFDYVKEFVTGALPELIPVALNALMSFTGTLRENVGMIVDSGLELIMALAQSLIDNLPVMIETIPTIVTNIAGLINDNAPKLLVSGIELIGKLLLGILQAVPTLIMEFPKIIQAIFAVFTAVNWISLGLNIINFIKDGITQLSTSIPEALKNIGHNAVEWLKNVDWRTLGSNIITFIKDGIQSLVTAIPDALRSIATTALDAAKNVDWLGLGANIIMGIVSGIGGVANQVADAILGAIGDAWDAVTGWLGIKSPSRRARDVIGKNWALGIGMGFEENMPEDDMVAGAKSAMEAIQDTLTMDSFDIPMSATANMSGNGAGRSGDMTAALYELLVQYLPQLSADRNIYFNDGAWAGRLAPSVNEELGRIAAWEAAQ